MSWRTTNIRRPLRSSAEWPNGGSRSVQKRVLSAAPLSSIRATISQLCEPTSLESRKRFLTIETERLRPDRSPWRRKWSTTRARRRGRLLAAAGVSQISRHWGVFGRFSLTDLVGSSVRDSPLTQRTFTLSSFALGVAYSF